MPDTDGEPQMERESVLPESPGEPITEQKATAGPRLDIRVVQVNGVVEYPSLGVTRQLLSRAVENIRAPTAGTGSTAEATLFRADAVAEPQDKIDDNHPLVFIVEEDQRARGVTVSMIENLAQIITRYYRERGFILAKAYIPEQRVRDGVVTLALLVGNLGEVAVQNNKKYRDKTLQNVFESALKKPVTAANIEQYLYLVNDMPGLAARGYFEPGNEVGETRLNVNVMEEKRFAGNVRADNHGSENTGEYRLYTDGYWNNPGGIADELHIGLLGTFEPSNSLYGSIHYSLPLFSPRTRFTLGGSSNDFVSDSLSSVTLTGKSVVYDATLSHFILRSRAKNYSTDLRFSSVESEIEDREGILSLEEGELDDTARNLDLVFNFDVLLDQWQGLHQGAIRLTYGDFAQGRGVYQDKNPVTLTINYALLKFTRVPFTTAGSRVQLRFAGQYSDTSLPSTSQLSLTGPTRMRAFDVNQYNADVGAYLGFDWIFNAPNFGGLQVAGEHLSSLLQPYVFWDAGYGDTKDAGRWAGTPNVIYSPKQPGTWALMSDVGVGLRFSLRNQLRANFSYAYATSYENDLGPHVRENLQDLKDRGKFYFDMLYSF